MAFSKKLVNGEVLTEQNFKSPPRELGILPFWFWNGEMNEEEMEWQLREYKDKGIPGLFIHGRFGEKIGYLSDTWFERVKFAVEKAKEIGIDIWIYDEMNWPSGTAERQVLKNYPHLTQKYLELVALNVDGPLFTFLEASDDRYVNTGNSKPIAAFACSDSEFQTKIEKLIDLTPNLSFDKVIPWEAPEGKWRLLYFLEKEVPYYIDTLNPESTSKFIEITHEQYKIAVGEDFGKIVPGFYTDEPAMHYYHVGIDNYVVPWSHQMFKIFREKRGYDLKPHLPALYLDMGEKTAEIRYDFWRTLTEQYAETYYKRLHDWCEENGVLFTGHVLFEEWLRLQARCEGNIFKYLEHMHITGVDHLYPKIGTREEPDQHVALKLGSSAAHHFGSARLLCESMGGTYWDCSLERMKWIANWEYVLGVNLLNNHGYHYSIEGERKRDWPPSQFYHHTWWKYYNHFTTYMARLGHILSGGRHVAKILIIWPINSMWANYVPQKHNKITGSLESNFNWLTDALLRLHFDFDYVDEDVLSKARVKNGKIFIANEDYELLVLPHLTHIKKTTLDTVRKFIRSGGKILADTLLPVQILETKRNGTVKEFTSLFGYNPEDLLKQLRNGYKAPRKNRGNKNLHVLNAQKLTTRKKEKELNRILNRLIIPDVTISNEEVFYLHRIKDGYDIYFLVNTSQKNIGEVEISFEKTGHPELWDPVSGNIKPLNVFRIKNNRTWIRLDFNETASHIVVLGRKIPAQYVFAANLVIESVVGKTVFGYSQENIKQAQVRLENKNGSRIHKQPGRKKYKDLLPDRELQFEIEDDNVLCIDRWKMKIAADEGDDFAQPGFNDASWLSVTAGAWEMQLPQERDDENYPLDLLYRTTFIIQDVPSKLSLLIDGFSGSGFSLFINGKQVNPPFRRSRLDAEIREADIRDYVSPGVNHVAVKLTVSKRTDGILDLLKITGDFMLIHDKHGFKIACISEHIKPGSWTEAGYPFYSGTASYKMEFYVPEKYMDGKLFLEAECGEDVMEVAVNGKDPKVIPWHPYKIDISSEVAEGKNIIELKITNTLINMLEGKKQRSGLLKLPRIIHCPKYVFKI